MLKRLLRKKIILLICCFFQTMSFAQSKKIDSMLQVLKVAKEDTGKVNVLNALSLQFIRENDVPNAKKYADDAVALAEKKSFKKGIKDAHNNLASSYHLQGNLCQGKGNYPEALKNYLVALKIRESIGERGRMAYTYGNIGLVYWNQKNYSEALKNQFMALSLFEEVKNKNGVAGTYNNIGLVYENQGNYAEAMKNYRAAITEYEEAGLRNSMVNLYFNIGFLYENQGKYPEALKSHLTALELSRQIESEECIAVSYDNIGDVYCHQAMAQNNFTERKELFDQAMNSYSIALDKYEVQEDKEGVESCYQGMGEVFLGLKNYSRARELLDSALAISIELGMIGDTREIYRLLTMTDSASGNWENAYSHHKQFIFYRDSILNEENTKKTMKAQMQFDFDKREDSIKYQQSLTGEQLKRQTLLTQQQSQAILLKEKELLLVGNEKKFQELQAEKARLDFAAQKVETERKQDELTLVGQEKAIQKLELKKQKQLKNYLLGGLALFCILSFFIYRNYRTRQQLRLQTIRNKIASDLHDDVGSTLSSISIFSQMAQQQSKEVIPMLDTIGESSRKMLDAMADIVWAIKPENDQFEKIVLRMKNFAYDLLGAGKIDFEFAAGDEVNSMNLPMDIRKNLYLIFKEATNNLVKYSRADKATFAINGEKNWLTMTIRDNGKGFDMAQSTKGNGLKNMRMRAEEIGAQFTIDASPGSGTSIYLKVAV